MSNSASSTKEAWRLAPWNGTGELGSTSGRVDGGRESAAACSGSPLEMMRAAAAAAAAAGLGACAECAWGDVVAEEGGEAVAPTATVAA